LKNILTKLRILNRGELSATAVEERNISQLDVKLQERRLNMF
jgi:hypothetical protein